MAGDISGARTASGEWGTADIHRAAQAAVDHAGELLALVVSGRLGANRDAATRAARQCALAADRAAGGLSLYDSSRDTADAEPVQADSRQDDRLGP